VYYRYNAKQKADELKVRGFVQNLPDGSVEAVAEGEEEDVKGLIEWCRRGPRGARVEGVRVEWDEPSHRFADFSIRY